MPHVVLQQTQQRDNTILIETIKECVSNDAHSFLFIGYPDRMACAEEKDFEIGWIRVLTS